MADTDDEGRKARLIDAFDAVRRLTESLAAPLSAEDQTVQSIADVSPTKWHRAHTSWFFETFVLGPGLAGYVECHPAYGFVFNSYYEAVGARHPRAARGLISRPGIAEVAGYRRHVDAAMARLLALGLEPEQLDLVELGVHHEQQHQELLLMDIKHVLWSNPLLPAYAPAAPERPNTAHPPKLGWTEHEGGTAEVGHAGRAFSFDNECPRHRTELVPFALADRPVTCGEWQAFIDDGGYARPELWLSDGWAAVHEQQWTAPLYWTAGAADFQRPPPDGPADPDTVFTLRGARRLDPAEPVCHVSYYEADAFARWSSARLPSEAEWEVVAATQPPDEGNLLGSGALHPRPGGTMYGDVWEWTASAYSPYPGFRAAPGAVGEYNGKFMVNQQVLRGGACVTPRGHVRPTYRNFFPPGARWAFAGLRLARDL
ncbi:MAG: ergothioneine biosynthesis protein EgtB [Acidimicrobiales bacterium]